MNPKNPSKNRDRPQRSWWCIPNPLGCLGSAGKRLGSVGFLTPIYPIDYPYANHWSIHFPPRTSQNPGMTWTIESWLIKVPGSSWIMAYEIIPFFSLLKLGSIHPLNKEPGFWWIAQVIYAQKGFHEDVWWMFVFINMPGDLQYA